MSPETEEAKTDEPINWETHGAEARRRIQAETETLQDGEYLAYWAKSRMLRVEAVNPYGFDAWTSWRGETWRSVRWPLKLLGGETVGYQSDMPKQAKRDGAPKRVSPKGIPQFPIIGLEELAETEGIGLIAEGIPDYLTLRNWAWLQGEGHRPILGIINSGDELTYQINALTRAQPQITAWTIFAYPDEAGLRKARLTATKLRQADRVATIWQLGENDIADLWIKNGGEEGDCGGLTILDELIGLAEAEAALAEGEGEELRSLSRLG